MKLTFDMVKTMICENMMNAVNAYRDSPSANNYNVLQDAMLAYQQIGQVSHDKREELLNHLWNIGIGHWDDAVVKFRTGKTLKEHRE